MSFFPRDVLDEVLDEVLDLLESVSEGFHTYFRTQHRFGQMNIASSNATKGFFK